MHTVTIVLLPPTAADLWQAGSDLLRPHRDGGDRPSRLDHWTVGGGAIADDTSAAALGVGVDPDLARNVCFVARLRPDFVPGAVVTPDGGWHDLADLGWRFLPGDNPANRAAWDGWVDRVRQLLVDHPSCVAVEFDTHS